MAVASWSLKRRVAAMVMLSACAPLARAGEHVLQRNGFRIDCVRHEVHGDKVRLYLTAGEENYIELAAAAVLSVEVVPDPPAELPAIPLALAHSTLIDPQPTPAELQEILARAGAQHHIDTDLLASVVHAESGGQVHAKSHAGACGLMQLMPGTAIALGVQDSFVADQNVEGGTRYLDALLTRYHDNMALALAAYNAGPAAVDRFHGVPPFRETRVYVARVIREFNRRKTVLLARAK